MGFTDFFHSEKVRQSWAFTGKLSSLVGTIATARGIWVGIEMLENTHSTSFIDIFVPGVASALIWTVTMMAGAFTCSLVYLAFARQ